MTSSTPSLASSQRGFQSIESSSTPTWPIIPKMSSSAMDERTVRDLGKCFHRVMEHLAQLSTDRAADSKKRKKKKRSPDQQEPPGEQQQDQVQDAPQPEAKDLLQEMLPIALYFLDMRPLVSLPPACAAAPVGVLPLRVDRDEVSPDSRRAMRSLSLDLLSCFVRHFDRTDLFPLWVVVLPLASRNPYRHSLMDKLLMTEDKEEEQLDREMQSKLVGVVGAFVDKIGTFFRFVERPSANLGFTPMYQSLGESLARAHEVMVAHVDSAAAARDSSGVTGAVKTLGGILRSCPYRKLGLEPLRPVMQLANRLLSEDNPVIKIAGLNLHLTAMLVASDSNGEADDAFDVSRACKTYVDMSCPGQAVTDNNVRYVSLQNLGHAASKKISWLQSQNVVSSLTGMVSLNLKDSDGAVVLHTLRICRWIAKHDPANADREDQANPSSSTTSTINSSSSSFMPLWNLVLRPRSLQALESRSEPTLEALICDVISELGEGTFGSLTHEQRMLCVSYVLCRCRDSKGCSGPGSGLNSQVMSSAFRALGMLLCFKGLRDDVSFLADCTETISEVMESHGAKVDPAAAHSNKSDGRSMVTSATWALASLSEALLGLKNSEDAVEECPRLQVLRLLTVSAGASRQGSTTGNMIAQVNLLRCAGALVQCVDGGFFSGDPEADQELMDTLKAVLDFVLGNVRGADMMKVQWNACHASGKIFRNSYLWSHSTLRVWREAAVSSLIDAIESSPNFKVKISACVALSNFGHCSDFGDGSFGRTVSAVAAQLESLESLDAAGGEGLETKHRLDLADNLVLLFCRLIVLAKDSNSLLDRAESLLSRDHVDNFRYVISQVRRRVSPEKEALLSEAAETAAGRNKVLSQLFSDPADGDNENVN